MVHTSSADGPPGAAGYDFWKSSSVCSGIKWPRGGAGAQSLTVHSISDSHALVFLIEGLMPKICHSRGQLSHCIYFYFKQ